MNGQDLYDTESYSSILRKVEAENEALKREMEAQKESDKALIESSRNEIKTNRLLTKDLSRKTHELKRLEVENSTLKAENKSLKTTIEILKDADPVPLLKLQTELDVEKSIVAHKNRVIEDLHDQWPKAKQKLEKISKTTADLQKTNVVSPIVMPEKAPIVDPNDKYAAIRELDSIYSPELAQAEKTIWDQKEEMKKNGVKIEELTKKVDQLSTVNNQMNEINTLLVKRIGKFEKIEEEVETSVILRATACYERQ